MKWSIGVTTVPARRSSLLPRTLASLKRAGFDSPRLFVDDCHDPISYQQEFGLEVTSHWPKIGPFMNWHLALWELWTRSLTGSEMYMMAQDDCLMSFRLREYLEESERRGLTPSTSYKNLLEFPNNLQHRHAMTGGRDIHGWYRGIELSERERAPKGFQRGLGAVCLVFSRKAVETYLSTPTYVNKPADRDQGYRKVDGAIVCAMNTAGWSEYVHSPSLVDHLGHVTSIHGPGRPQATHPKIPSWRGEDFDCMSLLQGGSR
jgi:hypothetical protein